MKKVSKIFLTAFLFLTVSGCGYDGHYRYSCQDPENWELEECNPPICEVDGNCTEVLLGFIPGETTVPDETIPVEETVAP
jgi:hypothetical protein